eukprot:CAMPEP_0172584898 /NCGR_PEP_ID=MMETSP1068-20121228/4442_1 /TAXON_ID=35684 /ORGANISM="Pseudopedinella elastica, Strain CCMP716" /LENGTH=71 /DNA_ID=CAMNT_0013379209 /DNA_START=49 /DNA_END=264 /DNA_ORIENTATION=-
MGCSGSKGAEKGAVEETAAPPAAAAPVPEAVKPGMNAPGIIKTSGKAKEERAPAKTPVKSREETPVGIGAR